LLKVSGKSRKSVVPPLTCAPNPATPHSQALAASASGQIGLQMKRQIQILGTYKLDDKTDSFSGTVTFDERENSIYYSWNLFDKEGKRIAGKSLHVAYQQIPVGQDRFEFSKAHAIEGIKEYRIGRDKIIKELRTS
jgi:hypothetical protein